MRRLYLIFILFSIKLFSQELSIQNYSNYLFDNQYLISERDNDIKIILEKTDCKNILVFSDNSEIEKISPCFFKVKPKKGKTTNLKIFLKKNNDTLFIKEKIFRLKNDFKYKSTISYRGKMISDSLSIEKIKSLKLNVTAYPLNQVCFNFLTKNILEYRIILVKKNNNMFTAFNKGSSYTKESIDLLKMVTIDDDLIFVNIKMKSQLEGKDDVLLNPLSFKVTK